MQRSMWGVLFFAFAVTVQAKVITKEVNYTADGLNLKGYLAYDEASKDKRPGVLVVHEWWGQNEYIRKRARMLAELGYVALALDMYGEGKQATHPEDAGKFSGAVMKNLDVAISLNRPRNVHHRLQQRVAVTDGFADFSDQCLGDFRTAGVIVH